jgi:formylglycine-generating enzyme required for sulfatase activity
MQSIYSKLEYQWIESSFARNSPLFQLCMIGDFSLEIHQDLQKNASFTKRIEDKIPDRFDDAELSISIYNQRIYRYTPNLLGIQFASLLLVGLDYEKLDVLDRHVCEALILAHKNKVAVLFILFNPSNQELKHLPYVFSNATLAHQKKYEEKLGQTLTAMELTLNQEIRWFNRTDLIWDSIDQMSLKAITDAYPFKYLDAWVKIDAGHLEIEDENGIQQLQIPHDFYLSQVPVTQGFYQKVMKVALENFQGNSFAVNYISYLDAVKFCNRLSQLMNLEEVYQIKEDEEQFEIMANFQIKGFRLPTELEWLYAATANDPYLYAGSNDANDVAWSFDNSGSKLHKVGRLKPNRFGLYDMNGNVWEWCEENDKEPRTTIMHEVKALQGGSFFNSPLLFPLVDKIWDFCECRSEYNGFRVMLVL